jgi:hypothetical protein
MAVEVEIYVDEAGQAKEAGLMKGDVLVSYDGKAVRTQEEIGAWVRTSGDTLRELVASRIGRRISFKMKPGLMGILMGTRVAPGTGSSNALDR